MHQPQVAQVTDYLQRARLPREKYLFLEALGNAGHPAALEAIAEYTKHADEQLRLSATSALRHIPGEKADSIIAQALVEDNDEDVRCAAAHVSMLRPEGAGEQLFAALKQAYINEEIDVVRAQIIRSIWENRVEFPEAENIIKEAAESEPSREVRDLATSLILTSDEPEQNIF